MYDGASVMSGHLNGLQLKVLKAYAHTLHMHCCAVNLVLSQSRNNIEECFLFFPTLNGIATFTSHSTKRTHALTEYLKRKIPSLAANRWSFSSHLVNVIEEHRIFILKYIEYQEGWSTNDRMMAIECKKFQTFFLLKLFPFMFAHSDILFHILQTKGLDIAFSFLKNEHDTGFPLLWKSSNDVTQP
jgi:hypothetical protein